MGKVYFLLLFFAVFGIFSGERGVNNRLRVRGADAGDYKDARNPLYRLGYFRKYSWQGSGKTILSGIKGLYFCELMQILLQGKIPILGKQDINRNWCVDSGKYADISWVSP